MEFSGVMEKRQVDFPGVLLKIWNVLGVIKKKLCGISRGLGFRP